MGAVAEPGADRGPLAGPAEGWSALVLLAIMLLALAAAVDDAGWAGTTAWGASETAFLLPTILLGGLVGLIAAKSSLGWLAAHVVNGVVAAGFLLVAVAGVVSEAQDPAVRIGALVDSGARFYHDLFVLGVRSSQTSVFLLVIGALTWTTGYFASFVTFRRGRPLHAVVVTGLFVLVELSLTIKDQYPYLIVFTAAALLFLVRVNLVEQRAGWLRRRIGDAGYVSGLYMRSGIAFVSVALVGAVALTAAASSAPLYGWWRGLNGTLVTLGQRLDLVVGGVTGTARGPSDLFASSATITGIWQSSSDPVFSYSPGSAGSLYWMGATYDTFDGTTWTQTNRGSGTLVKAGGELLAATRDRISAGSAYRTVKLTVTNLGLDAPTVLSPELPGTVDHAVTVYTRGADGPFAAAEFVDPPGPNGQYTVTALVRPPSGGPGGLTEAELAAASERYPNWLAPYVQYRGAVGPLTVATAQAIVNALPASHRDAFDIAKAIQDYFQAPADGFVYQTDVLGLCSGHDLVDCFLTKKRGYCEYFATAMTMMLRSQGIPARYVRGYLPGQPLTDGSYLVTGAAAHAWVDVYFPGYGWVRFDPTPGNGAQPTTLVPGIAVPSASAGLRPGGTRPRPTIEPPDIKAGAGRTFSPPLAGGTAGSGGPLPGGPIGLAVAVLLACVVLVLGLAARWRRSQPVPEPDAVYRGVARLAGRFGYGPRPTQTAYEYAGALGEVVPGVRAELQLVARAKVETTYAGRPPRGETLVALREAYRRLRLGLLRLALRRRRPRS